MTVSPCFAGLMIHPLWSYLEIEFSHFTYRFPNNGFDFFMQPVSESTVRTIDFGEINFAAHFVAYEKLQRFDKIDVSQNSLLCPARTVAPAKRPMDLRVFSQTHMDSPLRKISYVYRFTKHSKKSGIQALCLNRVSHRSNTFSSEIF